MRVAVIADIHGNCSALEAVLNDVRCQGIKTVVNLGDHFSGPLEPARTADLLLGLNFASICGNHDRWLIEQRPSEMNLSDRAADRPLNVKHRQWLLSLPATLVFCEEIFLCHGTPTSDMTYWLEQVTADALVHMAPIEKIEEEAKGVNFPVILCGHTHIPRVVRLRDGRLIVNPGSVGSPGYYGADPVQHVMQAGTPQACYAMLDHTDGRWSVDFRYVPYEHLAMAELAAKNGRPEWASALATGWIR